MSSFTPGQYYSHVECKVDPNLPNFWDEFVFGFIELLETGAIMAACGSSMNILPGSCPSNRRSLYPQPAR